MKVIWLDDEREPYNFLYEDLEYKEKDITICKNYSQFVKTIEQEGLPEFICFDHDLGEEKTGYDCAKFLVDYCLKNKLKLPDWYIQSANIVGKMNIAGLLKNYKKEIEKS